MVEESGTFTGDEKERTLYVRLPKTIKDDKEVMSLFPEDVKVKLPRQTSKCCHVIFPTIEERIKCLKTMKKKLVDGKKIVLMPLSQKNLDKRKKKIFERNKQAQKKVSVPVPKLDVSLVQTLHVSNIPNGISIPEIKKAFPGCLTIALLKGAPGKQRAAVVKMQSIKLATAYLKKEIIPPAIGKNVIKIGPYHKKSKAKRRKQKNLSKIKQESDNSDFEVKDEVEEETED